MTKRKRSTKDTLIRKHESSTLEPRDLVLVRHKAIKGKQKISDHWEKTPYKVVRRMGKLPVYKVQVKGDTLAKRKVLHRNLLFPVGYAN